jgi:hypothetical protein
MALARRIEVEAEELRIRRSKANCCARSSSPFQAQKQRILARPVLYRNGALGEMNEEQWVVTGGRLS